MRTLSDYTHWTSPHSGVQLKFVEDFHKTLTANLPVAQHKCVLLMDEMKIKRGLVFNKHTGELTGFVDLGSVSTNLERVFAEEDDNSEGGDLADQVFCVYG